MIPPPAAGTAPACRFLFFFLPLLASGLDSVAGRVLALRQRNHVLAVADGEVTFAGVRS